MEMFWIKRLKSDESRWQWALPYGDLMSLLLAVFVMIAAMSEMRVDDRFQETASSVRSAFGFSRMDRSSAFSGLLFSERPTMLERLAAVPYRKPPWSDRYPKLVDLLKHNSPAPEGNVITRNVAVGGRWGSIFKGAEEYSTIKDNWIGADVEFVDKDKMDFRLPDDSRVYEKIPGFEKIPFREIGPRGGNDQ